ncbi:MAG: GNAT family N-acetyltransferase [Candidatus Electrothrix sp. AR4]|nr:GNAT family N-acetyltransferase [Candidatus Electrothrix sp. AR4]
MKIVKITTPETLSLRHSILRPHASISECIYPGDDDQSTGHFGAFDHGVLVGIVSIYRRNNLDIAGENGFQLRAMATVRSQRGKGLGCQLLHAAEKFAIKNKARYIWANARVPAVGFYTKSSYAIKSKEFLISGVGPHLLVSKSVA